MNQAMMYERALRRPKNYNRLPPQRQWMIDKKLKILDWDGSCLHRSGTMCNECELAYKNRPTNPVGPIKPKESRKGGK